MRFCFLHIFLPKPQKKDLKGLLADNKPEASQLDLLPWNMYATTRILPS